MRIGTYKGCVISVFLRDEHCPPHVHVRGTGWDARFRFSFLDDGVELWDVDPERRRPPGAVLLGICQALRQRHYPARARGFGGRKFKRSAWRTIPGTWGRMRWYLDWSSGRVFM